MDTQVAVRIWHYPAEQIPGPDEQEAWLYDRWAEIDSWISGHRPLPARRVHVSDRIQAMMTPKRRKCHFAHNQTCLERTGRDPCGG